MKTMLFNPYSGKPRHPLDIASDPEGRAMVDPDEPLKAAQAVPSPAPSLTDGQIEAGWERTFSTNNPFCPCDLKSFTKAARWAERALAAPVAQPEPRLTAKFFTRWRFSESFHVMQMQPDGQYYSKEEVDAFLAAPSQPEPATDWNDAIEAAAKRIENGSFLHDQSPPKRFANEVVPVIRALKRAAPSQPESTVGERE